MKLRGTKTEDDVRTNLFNSNKFILENPDGARLLKILTEACGQVKSAYVISDTPEQGERFFCILVNSDVVIGFGLPHNAGEDVIDVTITPLNECRNTVFRNKIRQIELAVALELAEKYLSDT